MKYSKRKQLESTAEKDHQEKPKVPKVPKTKKNKSNEIDEFTLSEAQLKLDTAAFQREEAKLRLEEAEYKKEEAKMRMICISYTLKRIREDYENSSNNTAEMETPPEEP